MKIIRYLLVDISLVCVFLMGACSESVTHDTSATGSTQDMVLANRVLVQLDLAAPPDIKIRSTGPLTEVFLGRPTGVKNAIGQVSFSNDAKPNGFPPGKTTVTWVATDSIGNAGVAYQDVVVTEQACNVFEASFSRDTWPVLQRDCLSCHNKTSASTALNFVSGFARNALAFNFRSFRQGAAKTDLNGNSLLLSKTSNVNGDHVAGEILQESHPDYLILQTMVDNMEVCYEDNIVKSELVLADSYERWRKTALALAGRLPTPGEERAINSAFSEIELEIIIDGLLDNILTEDDFYSRLKEIYNDVLLTNAYTPDTRALALKFDNFSNKAYFSDKSLSAQGYKLNESRTIRRHLNYGIAQAPLELIKHVVKHDLPFTEILTADYLMVNAYSATLFSGEVIGDPVFNFSYGDRFENIDPQHFRPAKTVDRFGRYIPHAGILTTLPFLSRYPSTTTNVNRARARYVFQYFLGVDVEGLADRGSLDLTNQVGEFPTLQDAQCTVCHDVIDPVAGAFKNWDDFGRYRGDYNLWPSFLSPPRMLAPGFNIKIGEWLPASENAFALPWLAGKIVADNRFALNTVHTIYRSLTGREPGQDTFFFEDLKKLFVSSNYNLKVLIKAVINSMYFRAENAILLSGNQLMLEYGMGHLLSPEQLHRKIIAVTDGYAWYSPSGKNLIDGKTYQLLYGGIDSVNITQRNILPNGLTAGIQKKIALQLGCELAPLEFSQVASQRALLPFVEMVDLPNNDRSLVRIKNNIQYLYKRILGEQHAVNSSEVNNVSQFFLQVWQQTRGVGLVRECGGFLNDNDPIVQDQLKTVRSWMAVLSYFFSDYRFFYE